MTSLWLSDRIESPASASAFDATAYDVVVVGAGITGLTTAVLLARAGKHVAVLEARYVGAGATGNTTGKISLLQGTKLSRIGHKHGKDVLRGYVAGNTEARDWLLRYCEEHGLSVQREDATPTRSQPPASRTPTPNLRHAAMRDCTPSGPPKPTPRFPTTAGCGCATRPSSTRCPC